MIIPLMKKKQWTKYDNIFMIKKFSEKQEKRNFLFDKEHLKKKKTITIQITLYLMAKD